MLPASAWNAQYQHLMGSETNLPPTPSPAFRRHGVGVRKSNVTSWGCRSHSFSCACTYAPLSLELCTILCFTKVCISYLLLAHGAPSSSLCYLNSSKLLSSSFQISWSYRFDKAPRPSESLSQALHLLHNECSPTSSHNVAKIRPYIQTYQCSNHK